MNIQEIFQTLPGRKIHLTGIKGTGMTALAEILTARGAVITGSDVKEKFYTDAILNRLQLPVKEEFTAANLGPELDLVIYSPAYQRTAHPELIQADKLKLPLLNYPQALGALSATLETCGISGIHGKSSTTALAGVIARAVNLPAVILAGAEVADFNHSCTLSLGNRYFIAEACEYRAHFLNLHPSQIVITAVELDHPDYFANLEEVYHTFTEFCGKLPASGSIIYNADDPGACTVITRVKDVRTDLNFYPFGEKASGDFRLEQIHSAGGELSFDLAGVGSGFKLQVPGLHNVWNAAAAIALVSVLVNKERGGLTFQDVAALKTALCGFRGCRRRSEILGEAGGILVLDDYGHHPTAIRKTLQGYREFYPDKRLVVDFMPHTFSRTHTLLTEFGSAFQPAAEVILHPIYSSARESHLNGITGRDLFTQVRRHQPCVSYFETFDEAIIHLQQTLQPGDLLVTMGAGNNWQIGRTVYEFFRQQAEPISAKV